MDLRKTLYERHEEKAKRFRFFITAIIVAVAFAAILLSLTLRLDFAAGSHRIIPTAVDTNFWGHYRVYFRGAHDVFLPDAEESHYYILRGNTELANEVRQAILNGQQIVVFYERWVGFKPIGSPSSGPIYRIEVVG